MEKVVLVGGSTPMQRVLSEISRFDNLEWCGLFTPFGEGREIRRKAEELKVKLFDIELLKRREGLELLAGHTPDWLLNINSTFIFPKSVLDIPRKGCLNMHPGKLPEYAGMHVNQWAIRNDEKFAGATLHWMESRIDAGQICYQEEFPVLPCDTGLSVFMKAMNAGTRLAIKALTEISAGRSLPRIEQDLSRRKIFLIKDSKEGFIDWGQSSRAICNFVRAADYAPFKSPTYSPEALVHGRRIYIRKVRHKELDEFKDTVSLPHDLLSPPGTVVEVCPAGVIVRVGSNEFLEIQKVEFDSRLYENEEIARSLGLALGDQFARHK